MRRSIWALSLMLLFAAGRGAAQEVQAPMDVAGRVERVDRHLAERLGLWINEFPGFQEARLFQVADSSFVLEISMLRDGRVVRERLPRSASEVAQLRQQVQAGLDAQRNLDERGVLNQEGRHLLLGQTTLAGLTFYGSAVPYVLGLEDSGAAGGYLLTAASSFFLPFVLTQDQPVTYGMANLSRYGVSRGILHGILLHGLVAGEVRDRCGPVERPCDGDGGSSSERARLATAVTVSIAEGVGGYLWARNARMTAGTANAIAGSGDAGLFWGVSAAAVIGSEDPSLRGVATVVLPVTAATIVAGHQLAQRRDFTWGDADLIHTAGIVGALSGYAATDLAGGGDASGRLFAGAGIVGSAAGIYIADRLVRNTDFSVGQAALNRLGTFAGALAGASLGVLAENGTVALTGTALGAAAGYALTYAAHADDAPAGRGERIPSSAWEFRIQPQGLLAAGVGSRPESEPAPLFNVSYRFGGR